MELKYESFVVVLLKNGAVFLGPKNLCYIDSLCYLSVVLVPRGAADC